MAAKKRTPTEIDRDRAEVARRCLRGELQRTIGEDLGLSRQMVGYDLKAIRARWKESAIRDFDEAVAQELAKINEIEREYWVAWEESKKDKETVTEQSNERGFKSTHRREGQVGAPQFLSGVAWCIERRCALLGLDAPKKAAPTDPKGEREWASAGARAPPSWRRSIETSPMPSVSRESWGSLRTRESVPKRLSEQGRYRAELNALGKDLSLDEARAAGVQAARNPDRGGP